MRTYRASHILIIALEVAAAAALCCNKRFHRHERIKCFIILAEVSVGMTAAVLGTGTINSTVIPPTMASMYITFSQIRLDVAQKLHLCNLVKFVVLQINAFMRRRSWQFVVWDCLCYAAVGVLIPLAYLFHTEKQARQAFVSKHQCLTREQVGPRWRSILDMRA